MKTELTDEDIARQDSVDNAIYELICNLNPTNVNIEWDIEMISNIRDSISYEFVRRGVCSENEFYPFLVI